MNEELQKLEEKNGKLRFQLGTTLVDKIDNLNDEAALKSLAVGLVLGAIGGVVVGSIPEMRENPNISKLGYQIAGGFGGAIFTSPIFMGLSMITYGNYKIKSLQRQYPEVSQEIKDYKKTSIALSYLRARAGK